jgi:hypothetical protein
MTKKIQELEMDILSRNHNKNQWIPQDKMTQWFFTEVHLHAAKLVPIMAIHPLGGSRANRHHMPNLQLVPHNQHKMGIHKPQTIH